VPRLRCGLTDLAFGGLPRPVAIVPGFRDTRPSGLQPPAAL